MVIESKIIFFQLIYVKNTTTSTINVVTPDDQIRRIAENLTYAISSHEANEERYNAFRAVVERIEKNCKKVAFNSIIDRANVTNTIEIKAQINDLYKKQVKDYPVQLRQAIIEQRMSQDDIHKAAVMVRKMCQQMLNVAKSKVKASKGNQ